MRNTSTHSNVPLFLQLCKAEAISWWQQCCHAKNTTVEYRTVPAWNICDSDRVTFRRWCCRSLAVLINDERLSASLGQDRLNRSIGEVPGKTPNLDGSQNQRSVQWRQPCRCQRRGLRRRAFCRQAMRWPGLHGRELTSAETMSSLPCRAL